MSNLDENTEGKLRPTGQLVAVKIPAPPAIKISARDLISLAINEKTNLHGTGEHTEAVKVSDSEGISSAVDVSESGVIRQAVVINKGRTPQNEEGGEQVCRTLIERLNLSGYAIDPVMLKRAEDENDDADFVARNGNEEIRFQVTRAAPTQSFWRSLAFFRKQDHQWAGAEPCTEGIREAIEQKAMKIVALSQRGVIILAIDAINSPVLVLNKTIRTFRRKHGAWACGLQFRAIWVVGPTSSLTHCVSISE